MQIRILMTGRGYHVVQSLPAAIELGDGATVGDALSKLRCEVESLIVDSMMVLVDGKHVGTVAEHEPVVLREGCELELLAPVAGG